MLTFILTLQYLRDDNIVCNKRIITDIINTTNVALQSGSFHKISPRTSFCYLNNII